MLIYVNFKNNSITLGKVASYLNIEKRKEEGRNGAEQRKLYSTIKTVKVIDKNCSIIRNDYYLQIKMIVLEKILTIFTNFAVFRVRPFIYLIHIHLYLVSRLKEYHDRIEYLSSHFRIQKKKF